jgi:hypothetical protein
MRDNLTAKPGSPADNDAWKQADGPVAAFPARLAARW